MSKEMELIPVREFPDRGTRWLLESPGNVRELVRLVAADMVDRLDFSRLEPVRTTFVSDRLRKQESDLVFLAPWREPAAGAASEVLIYVLVEHQSTPDPAMGFRLLYYMTLIWDRQRREWEGQEVPVGRWRFRPIIPLVFYTGSAHWRGETQLSGSGPFSVADLMDLPQALQRFVPHHATLLLNLKETDPGELVATGHPLGWVLRVMQQEGATREELVAALQEAMEGLGRLPSEEQVAWRQAVYYLLLLIYHRREPQERDALAQVVLESVREHLRRGEIEKMGKTIAEALIEEGKELGREEGKELGLGMGMGLGLGKGILQSRQEVLLKQMRVKFGTLPPTVVEKIEALQDIDRLDALLERVLTASSVEEMGISS